MIQRTDIAGPSAPQIINLTCHSQDAIFLQWRRPTSFYNSIDFYVINYKENSYSNFQQIQLNTSSSYSETTVCKTTKKIILCCTFFYLNNSFADVAWGSEGIGSYLREISPLCGDDFMQKLLIQQVHDAV